jgi:hypothetical protein
MNLAVPALPSRDEHTMPCLSCLSDPRLALTRRAIPRLPSPALPCQSVPCLAVLACRAIARLAVPIRASPSPSCPALPWGENSYTLAILSASASERSNLPAIFASNGGASPFALVMAFSASRTAFRADSSLDLK